MTLKQQIIEFIEKNHMTSTKAELYTEISEKFGISKKRVSDYYCDYNREVSGKLTAFAPVKNKTLSYTNSTKPVLDLKVDIDFEVKTLEDLLFVCDVDKTKWRVLSWECKKWDLGIKDADGKIQTKDLYSVRAKFAAIEEKENLRLQKDVIVKELLTDFYEKTKKQKHDEYSSIVQKRISNKTCLLELALFDIHFGKLAHKEEVGENYDISIAAERYESAVTSLLMNINLDNVERILLPIGQDLINFDNLQGTTTAGTPQDNDGRFHKVIKTVKNVLINTINKLSLIAPVDVVVTVGNHDEQTTFMLGEILDAYYINNDLVTINNKPALRKYYQYGTTSIMFTHGNKEKFNELGMIFAAENPILWASTTQRYIQIGHFHHNKKVIAVDTQEFQGFEIQIIPSLSGSDYWHTGKGFISKKQAKAFLYDKNKGKIAEFTHTV